MSELKKYREQNVLDAAHERLQFIFEEFNHVYLSVSGAHSACSWGIFLIRRWAVFEMVSRRSSSLSGASSLQAAR